MDDSSQRAGDEEYPPRGTFTREELQRARELHAARGVKKRRGKKPPVDAPHLPRNQRRHLKDGRRHMTTL